MNLRIWLGIALTGAAAACAAQGTWSPQRNVEIVVGSAPGGSNDKTARTVERILVANKLVNVTLAVVNKRKWRVVDARAPQAGRREGHIEAVARTPIMGFRDDVSIRVRAETDGARIDARSSSRYGSFDFGTNASRVRGLMNEIEDAIRAQRPERPPAQPSAKKSTPGKKDQSKK